MVLMCSNLQAQHSIEIVSGNNQTSRAGTELPNPLVVRVYDSDNNNVENAAVTFSVDLAPIGAVDTTLSTRFGNTDSNGQASTTLTLGSVAGDYEVLARIGALTRVYFEATATAPNNAPEFVDEDPTNSFRPRKHTCW